MPLLDGSHTVDVWLEQLDKLEYELEHLPVERVLNKAANRIRRDFRDHFDQALGPDGPWAPRTQSYSWPILIKTGALRRAAGVKGAPGNITRVEADFIELGVDDSVIEYASFHQYGTSKMVARPFLWVSEEAEADVDEIIADSVEEVLFG